ncbi:MAG: CoB--CoM heterodisulfide reductase iron-sulfur subunit A family protein [Anaerolineales bacterium]|nr:CoB--CoM heterodisulfide reductase iron-sulfur subunit A family protein [Anaerolineales bacterium]
MSVGARIGVYVCHCGVNIAAVVDVKQVTEVAAALPGVVVARDYLYMCSDPGQALITRDIAEYGLDRVVVASCSPRMHEPTFRQAAQAAGLNPYLVEMANVREQCAWVHTDRAAATEKAMRLVASAVAKAGLLTPLEDREAQVNPGALVIGGGIAGMAAALDVADAGFPVYLVERSDRLGGHVAELNRTFPTLEAAADLLEPLIARVQAHPGITVLLGTQVTGVDGYVGNFTVEVAPPPSEAVGIRVGAVIVATGYDGFNPRHKPEYGYGECPNVITSLEMEQRLLAGDLAVNGRTPRSVAFVQCVGSRDAQAGHPYCSRVCCMVSAKQAQLVRDLLPQASVTVFFTDVRTFGLGAEEFYDQTRAKGVRYRRGSVSEVYRRGERVVVAAEDTLLGRSLDHEADLVVLAVGMAPRADAGAVAGLLKLPRSADGFLLEAHPKLRPVDTAVSGVFLAGCCQAPKDIPDTVAQARAAASSALIPLLRGAVPIESATAVVDADLCAGCGACVQVCPSGAAALDARWSVCRVNSVLCEGCGACASACPSKAIGLQHYTAEQMLAQAEALAA